MKEIETEDLPRWVERRDEAIVRVGSSANALHHFAYGWPRPAARHLVAVTFEDETDIFFADEAYTSFGLMISEPNADRRFGTILSLRPIWPGFLINTLFYAAIWFILIFTWRMHLRQVRKWQGYCQTCKYDLRGNRTPAAESRMPSRIGCPECGWGRE